ncbi:hypothetical protein LCGC14_1596530 [marine sediment metagenome]|uniref:Uncharacterized protein n=1 Tax=marine sediment metagenome TaxID=412755 RepID=A0A0F9ICH5_9ZZZZ
MEQEEIYSVQRKMAWINTQLIVLNLFISVNIVSLVLIKSMIFRAISFFIISLFTLIVWYKWKKKIRDLI